MVLVSKPSLLIIDSGVGLNVRLLGIGQTSVRLSCPAGACGEHARQVSLLPLPVALSGLQNVCSNYRSCLVGESPYIMVSECEDTDRKINCYFPQIADY